MAAEADHSLCDHEGGDCHVVPPWDEDDYDWTAEATA